ncbi:MAG: efflux RND transporter periplasmic adaptor subunit [Acidobacteria bacterium]|nr:efflux RND transporter periplasmic adaptor subunit [Acidobacteriota bacterium]
MDPKLKKRLWFALGAVVVLVLVLVYLSRRQPLVRVGVVHAVRENLSASISTNGKVEPITPYSIRAQFSTFVEKVHVVEGQPVRRGQLLLTLDSAQTRAELDRAREQLVAAQDDLRAARAGGPAGEVAQVQSDLRKAEAERDRLRRERDALERLVARQAATKEELERNRAALERAEADWQRARKTKDELARRAALDVERAALRAGQFRHDVQALEEKVRSTQVTAPVDGTLYSLPVRVRDFVKTGDLLAELADLRRVRVRAFVDEPELGSLEPNQNVEISWDALPNRLWTGRTEQIPRQVVARGTRSVGEVLCSADNAKLELLPNINVHVRIHMRERPNAVVVPRGAVRIEGARRFVFVVEESRLGVNASRLQKREIRVGIASATNYEVLSGLREGETVALPGEVELRNGLGVRVIEGS